MPLRPTRKSNHGLKSGFHLLPSSNTNIFYVICDILLDTNSNLRNFTVRKHLSFVCLFSQIQNILREENQKIEQINTNEQKSLQKQRRFTTKASELLNSRKRFSKIGDRNKIDKSSDEESTSGSSFFY